MGVVTLRDIVGPAFDARYGVPAVNIVNDLSMEAVLAAAVAASSPMILQTPSRPKPGTSAIGLCSSTQFCAR